MLGIDIGSYSIKAAVTKKSGKKVIIDQIATEVLPADMRGGSVDLKTTQQVIGRLIKKVGKAQSVAALSIPTSSAILKTIDVDANLSGNSLEGEVQLELVNFVPFPLEQVYADFISLGKSKDNPDKQQVFVAASRRDIVDKVANSISSKAIKQKEVDVEAFAIGQILEQIKGKNYREAYSIIDIGYRSTTIYVFQNGEMLFSREQQVGGQHLTEAIAEANGLELEEAENLKLNSISSVPEAVITNYLDSLSEQIALAFEFFSSTNTTALATTYITGGGSNVPHLMGNLGENMPEQIFERLPLGETIKIGKKTYGMSAKDISYIAAVSAGLSMRK